MIVNNIEVEERVIITGIRLDLTIREAAVIAAALGKVNEDEVNLFLETYGLSTKSVGHDGDDVLFSLYSQLANHLGI